MAALINQTVLNYKIIQKFCEDRIFQNRMRIHRRRISKYDFKDPALVRRSGWKREV